MTPQEALILLLYALLAILAIVFTGMATTFMLALSVKIWALFVRVDHALAPFGVTPVGKALHHELAQAAPRVDIIAEYLAEAPFMARMYQRGYTNEQAVKAFIRNFGADVFGLALEITDGEPLDPK